MKDSNEMARSVLAQAEKRAAKRRHQRRMATGLIASALCLAILIAVVGVGGHPADGTQPTISVENPTAAPVETKPDNQSENVSGGVKVSFLSKKSGEETEIPLEIGIAVPMDYLVYFRDLRGLDDEGRNEAIEEWQEFDREMVENAPGGYQIVSFVGEDVIVCTYINGFLEISSDYGEIEHLAVSSTNDGIGDHGWGYQGGKFHVSWFLDSGVLVENPDTLLSEIRDSLVITIVYKDGTTERVVVDISIDNGGNVCATLAEGAVSA